MLRQSKFVACPKLNLSVILYLMFYLFGKSNILILIEFKNTQELSKIGKEIIIYSWHSNYLAYFIHLFFFLILFFFFLIFFFFNIFFYFYFIFFLFFFSFVFWESTLTFLQIIRCPTSYSETRLRSPLM